MLRAAPFACTAKPRRDRETAWRPGAPSQHCNDEDAGRHAVTNLRRRAERQLRPHSCCRRVPVRSVRGHLIHERLYARNEVTLHRGKRPSRVSSATQAVTPANARSLPMTSS